ncbi:hypothetical protein [Flavivirga rizhaonensis]|uniref:Uncharacterized protein n=1 Tax=Flavivirga rizhaonensis TaxID=2559571 RepID=A0A4S1E2M3_9FLAO|nr:hypothetical protein [Flavivirga rizhaonensis]TGV04603.1 hypothetical protein EM932_00300 [Flavivirga rizhaonensis]
MIKQSNYEVLLAPGEYLDRFEIAFSNQQQSLNSEDVEKTNLQVYFSNEKERIIIHNPSLKNIESVEMFNLLGQSLLKF